MFGGHRLLTFILNGYPFLIRSLWCNPNIDVRGIEYPFELNTDHGTIYINNLAKHPAYTVCVTLLLRAASSKEEIRQSEGETWQKSLRELLEWRYSSCEIFSAAVDEVKAALATLQGST